MTAKAAGFVTRAQAGLVSPRSVSNDIRPGGGGVAIHHGGANYRVTDHSACLRVWKGYQQWHMRPGGLGVPQGGNDIAYNFGVCPHGYVFAGRGLGVRSGANGDYNSNTTHYAICWMNDRDVPNVEVMNAIEWLILNTRAHGAGMQVKPHRFFYQTSCPADGMARAIVKYDGKKIDGGLPPKPRPPTPPTKVPAFPLASGQFFGDNGIRSGHGLSIWQGKMHSRGWEIAVDGDWGPQTKKVVLAFQGEKGLSKDGELGAITWRTAWTAKVTA